MFLFFCRLLCFFFFCLFVLFFCFILFYVFFFFLWTAVGSFRTRQIVLARPADGSLRRAQPWRSMWCRWKAGYHVREIARAFGRDHGSIRGLLARRGGIAPSVRSRGNLALTLI